MHSSSKPSSLTLSRPDFLEGKITLPGSKSETNRLLLLGALTRRPFRIYNYSLSDDSNVFFNFLEKLQVKVEKTSENTCTIYGCLLDSHFREVEIYLQEAGTGLRFLTAIAPFLDGTILLRGSSQLARRPIQPLLQTLIEAGAQIEFIEKEGTLPYKIIGNRKWQPCNFKLDTTLSSQLLSALLLLGPILPIGFRIFTKGLKEVSGAYVQLTLDILKDLGIIWKLINPNCLELQQNEILRNEYYVENDWTAASYWLGLSATLPSKIILPNLTLSSKQGDALQVHYFSKWGLEIIEGQNEIILKNNIGNLVNAFEIDFSQMPDIAQTFAVLACFAKKKCRLTGLQSLPYKETNRIQAIVQELTRLGVEVQLKNNSLDIYPASITNEVRIQTYNDHRMAMSFALLANLVESVTIIDPMVVTKSYPNFWNDLEKVGYAITRHFD